jgi:hypothetical protein
MDMVAHGEIGLGFSIDVAQVFDILKSVLPGALLKHIQAER